MTTFKRIVEFPGRDDLKSDVGIVFVELVQPSGVSINERVTLSHMRSSGGNAANTVHSGDQAGTDVSSENARELTVNSEPSNVLECDGRFATLTRAGNTGRLLRN